MSKRFVGRLFEIANTVRAVDLDDDDDDTGAPDEWVRCHCQTEAAGVCFVEIATSEAGPWQLWRCEVIGTVPAGAVLFTGRVTEDEARDEIRRGRAPGGHG
jgi:hypothetical protein